MSSTPTINASAVGNATNASAMALQRTPDFTVQGSDGLQHGVYVDQGPVWLVRQLYHPPPWLVPALIALTVVAVGLAAWKAWREGIDPEALRESVNRALFLGLVIGGVLLLRATGALPYLVTVFGGAIVGGVVAYAIRSSEAWDDLLDRVLVVIADA